MDESCRIGIGLMRGLPRRRSVENRSSSRRQGSIFSGSGVAHSEPVDADDFADVFGGPPRTLLAHKFSSSGSFYEGIFRQPEFVSPAMKGGRTLPVFRIPARKEKFYSDIFVSDDERKSRERSGSLSMANSSSVLSSEELSPRRPTVEDDVALSAFASKLRPINVQWRWNSSTMMSEDCPSKQRVPYFPCNAEAFEIQYQDNEYKANFKSPHLGFSRRVSSPETISLDSNSYQGLNAFVDDWELNSPISVASSLCQEPEAKSSVHDIIEQGDDNDDSDDEDEIMSSYVIEVNSNLRREDCEASSIDEAIAWAKEKFQSRSSEEESSMRNDGSEQTIEIGSPDASECHQDEIGIVQPPKKLETDTERLDRDIRLWSSGKETNIRLLLSTLHHILWHESGWNAIPLMSLIESSQVKKAFQKARLCLHPDKLQQKGATLLQKHVAEKAFSILQDAWAAFISQDVSF
ncbi:uncharacterized protein LOC130716162 isoform X3 [Lotus japonicus]|uniref:uncharacterized protein LOC130716162 isoform X3 n=1 Tax=Lotus japonicus TaxID=34305 RepID=UPI00258FD542|nr:uncharacterized protein LOC130716162 isoform X3 [Lotus japonicus]